MGTAARAGLGALIGYLDDPIDLGASAPTSTAAARCTSRCPRCTRTARPSSHTRRTTPSSSTTATATGRMFAGIITDFDADADTVVFYGTDYLGLLQTAVDERYNPDKTPRLAANGTGGGGSKYSDKTIDFVIKDQLRVPQGLANSPVGFITIGPDHRTGRAGHDLPHLHRGAAVHRRPDRLTQAGHRPRGPLLRPAQRHHVTRRGSGRWSTTGARTGPTSGWSTAGC